MPQNYDSATCSLTCQSRVKKGKETVSNPPTERIVHRYSPKKSCESLPKLSHKLDYPNEVFSLLTNQLAQARSHGIIKKNRADT